MKRFKRWLGRLLLGDDLIDAGLLSAEARQKIDRLDLRAGDVLVLTTELSLSASVVERLKRDAEAFLMKAFKREHRVMILSDGIGIKVLSTPPPPPPQPPDIPFMKG